MGLVHLSVRNVSVNRHRDNTLSRFTVGNDHFLFGTEEDGVHDTAQHADTKGNSSVGNDCLNHISGRKNEATLKKKRTKEKTKATAEHRQR